MTSYMFEIFCSIHLLQKFQLYSYMRHTLYVAVENVNTSADIRTRKSRQLCGTCMELRRSIRCRKESVKFPLSLSPSPPPLLTSFYLLIAYCESTQQICCCRLTIDTRSYYMNILLDTLAANMYFSAPPKESYARKLLHRGE